MPRCRRSSTSARRRRNSPNFKRSTGFRQRTSREGFDSRTSAKISQKKEIGKCLHKDLVHPQPNSRICSPECTNYSRICSRREPILGLCRTENWLFFFLVAE